MNLARAALGAVMLATCVGAATQAQAVLINFDTDAAGNPLTAPFNFSATTALRELYAPLGIHFSSGAPNNNGGGILNQGSAFGVAARSSPNFLAFNDNANYSDGGIAMTSEVMTFDTEIVALSLFGSGGNGANGASLLAFNALNVLVDADVVTLPAGEYALMEVSGPGITRVVLGYQNQDCCAVFDDLSFTPSGQAAAPEPGTLALLGLGLGFAGWARRRRLVR